MQGFLRVLFESDILSIQLFLWVVLPVNLRINPATAKLLELGYSRSAVAKR